jgi:sec-independent protein translocase protein TatB
MLDIGWTEMLVIVVLALIVIGPKDLPGALRTVGQWVRKARMLAREFQSGVDDMIREAELDEARKTLEATKRSNLGKTIRDQVDPEGELEKEAKSVEDTARTAARLDDPAKTAGTGAKADAPEADKGAAAKGTQGGSGEPETAGESAGDTAAGDAGAGDTGAGEGGKARIVQHPARIAPGNSVRPPKDEAKTETGGEGSSARDPSDDRSKASG